MNNMKLRGLSIRYTENSLVFRKVATLTMQETISNQLVFLLYRFT